MKSSTPASAAMAAAGQGIVARNHHCPNAHASQLGKTLVDATLDNVFEFDDAQHLFISGDDQGRPSRSGDGVDYRLDIFGKRPSCSNIKVRTASAVPLRMTRAGWPS